MRVLLALSTNCIPGLKMYSLFDDFKQSSCHTLIEKETISHFANDDPFPLWAIAAHVATHLCSGEGERRGGNKYSKMFGRCKKN